MLPRKLSGWTFTVQEVEGEYPILLMAEHEETGKREFSYGRDLQQAVMNIVPKTHVDLRELLILYGME